MEQLAITPDDYAAVVIGVSLGGLHALTTIIPHLPKGYPLSVVIVQHRRKDTDNFLARHLNDLAAVEVREALDKEPLLPGTVYVAGADYHLHIEAGRTFALSQGARENYCRPSIDVLFDSAADVYAQRLIGLVLTGANADGSRGLKHIHQVGGLAIVQDPTTAEHECMPQAAVEMVPSAQVLDLADIGPFLKQTSRRLLLDVPGTFQ